MSKILKCWEETVTHFNKIVDDMLYANMKSANIKAEARLKCLNHFIVLDLLFHFSGLSLL